ncbi:MAG TPA: arginine deiminase family protein [Planctomycetota bacterium]
MNARRLHALTHAVGARLPQCELTFVDRVPIDLLRARAQHAAYCELLRSCGVDVRTVDVSPDDADAVFVEDTVVVLDEVAIAASMGAASRRGEVDRMLPLLAEHRRVLRLLSPEPPAPPAQLEGGDVLRVGRRLFVGMSSRTNAAGADALRQLVAPFGYHVVSVAVSGCLHLKSGCTALDDATLLVNPDWIDLAPFTGLDRLAVDPGEPAAANVLRIGALLCMSASHPRTAERVRDRGHVVHTADIGEFEKAEAGMTCLSILIDGQ